MRFEQLRYLEAALRTGSFRKAADELHVSQPAITNQVQRLEEELGVVLVHRSAHGVTPTFAAESVLPHVMEALRAERTIRQTVSAVQEVKIGQVRLVASPVAGSRILPTLVNDVLEKHPNVQFEVFEGDASTVRDSVLTGGYDLGLLMRLAEDDHGDDQLQYFDLLSGRLVLCVPDTHRIAGLDRVSAAELSGEPIILLNRSSMLGAALERYIKDIDYRPVLRSAGLRTAIGLVRKGVGITIGNTLTPSLFNDEGIVLVPIQEEWARTHLSAVVRANELRSPVLRMILESLKAMHVGTGQSSNINPSGNTSARSGSTGEPPF